ncbi:hypothetical protein HAZT_HAZT002712 [Hyalella azteca]|uniref:C2H2-type domain-containing protein n=1 Tax=Hyalella azteca TaxID=294128 RepID=A0A6A0H715_HYAAZ|nr:hypothetical protein HAZT_HAZT002712 [Hyalella azteca]
MNDFTRGQGPQCGFFRSTNLTDASLAAKSSLHPFTAATVLMCNTDAAPWPAAISWSPPSAPSCINTALPPPLPSSSTALSVSSYSTSSSVSSFPTDDSFIPPGEALWPHPSNERPFVCSLCFKSFKRKDHLLIHVKIHTGDKPFVCTQCGNKFAQRTHLRNHMTKHSEVRAHACSICGKRFKRKDSLRMHEKIHRIGGLTAITSESALTCGVCGEHFPSLELDHLLFFSRPLSQGLSPHHDEFRPHQCSFCGRTFKRKDHRTEHERIHTGERPYKCNECGRSFVQKQQLARQWLASLSQPRDSGLRPDIYSGPSYRAASVLARRNTFDLAKSFNNRFSDSQDADARPHECSYCSRRFKEKHHLRQHVLLHTGEKPFVCSVCDARFVQVGHLKRHQFRHHFEASNSHNPHPIRTSSSITQLTARKFTQDTSSFRASFAEPDAFGAGAQPCLGIDTGFVAASRTKWQQHPLVDLPGVPLLLPPPQIMQRSPYLDNSLPCKIDHLSIPNINNPGRVNNPTLPESSNTERLEVRFAGSRTPKYISPEEMAKRPYKCQYCASRFNSKSNQKQHERLHTGEKPYRCNLCDMAFVQLSSLLHHKSRNHTQN